ncbi:MAG: hypothetical protein H8E18_00490 [FCB group bacterium]|nr:hypothetical protein [FCB group bacterium]
MLIARPTRHAAGIQLFGDAFDLESLHETIHHLCESSILVTHMEDYVLGLAYEVRKAFEGNRLKESFETGPDEKVEYYGVQLLWPQYLAQIALLRYAASSKPTNHEHQSNLYRLEHITLEALVEIDEKIAGLIFKILPGLAALNTHEYLFQFIDSMTMEYVTEFKTKQERVKELPVTLLSLSPTSPPYADFKKMMNKLATKAGCSPLELEENEEWPDFEW